MKVDTEGHDCTILEHFLNNFDDNMFLPHTILFESNILTNSTHTHKIISLLQNIGYDLLYSEHDTFVKLNIQKVKKTNKFSNKIQNYFIEDYPSNYNPTNLPHKNTLEDAKKYCIENNCSGVTYQNNKYEVKTGKYISYNNNGVLSWVYL